MCVYFFKLYSLCYMYFSALYHMHAPTYTLSIFHIQSRIVDYIDVIKLCTCSRFSSANSLNDNLPHISVITRENETEYTHRPVTLVLSGMFSQYHIVYYYVPSFIFPLTSTLKNVKVTVFSDSRKHLKRSKRVSIELEKYPAC